MAPLPESAFRSLLADCSQSTFTDFVADLWRARGREVRREDDRLLVDGRELRPVVDTVASQPADAVVVTATSTDADGAVGPGDLYRILLYDVPRERAADLFAAHFDRPLEAESTDGVAETSGAAPGTDARGDEADRPRDGASPGDDPGEEETASTVDETLEAAGGGASDPAPDADASGNGPTGVRAGVQRVARGADRSARTLRALSGDRRVQAVAVALLVVLASSAWVLFGYHPVPEPTEPPFDADEPPVDGNYRIVSKVDATGDARLYAEVSRIYAPGDPAVSVRRSTFGGADDRSEYVSYSRGDTSYVRMTWANGSAYREFRERLADDEDVVRTVDGTRAIYRMDRRSGEVSADPTLNLPVSTLAMLPYERDGTTTYEGREAVRYEPTAGWTARKPGPHSDRRTYRVRSASGEVLVDAETGALLYADVEATIVPAETWGDVLLESDVDLSIRYQVDADVDRPQAPPWVEGLEATATNATARNATAA